MQDKGEFRQDSFLPERLLQNNQANHVIVWIPALALQVFCQKARFKVQFEKRMKGRSKTEQDNISFF